VFIIGLLIVSLFPKHCSIEDTLNALDKNKLSTLEYALKNINSNEFMETYKRNNETIGRRLKDYTKQSAETKRKLISIANALGITSNNLNDLLVHGTRYLNNEITTAANNNSASLGVYQSISNTVNDH
jgi:hypothetical protein